MKNIFLTILTTFVLAAVFSPVPVFSENGPDASGKTVIGVILPFSSAFAKIADEQKNAIQIALAEAGEEVTVVYKDGQDNAAGAVKAFNELALMEHPPVAIISCASWASSALHPLAAEKGIFHIAIGSAIIARSQPGRTVRFTIDAKQEERQLAEYLSRFNRLAIFNMDNGYGNNWADIIKNHFQDKIVAAIAYDPQRKDFSPELTRIKDKNPDVLVLLSADNGARIAKQARAAGITAQLVGTRPIERPELLEEPQYTNGLVYTYPSHSFKHHLIGDYEKAYKTVPTIFGIEAYDAMTTLVRAIKEGNRSPEALFNWYAGRTYTGALGEVRFDENGDAAYPYMYKQIVDGRFQPAEFQYPMLLERTREQINGILREMDADVAQAAGKLSPVGIKGEEAKNVLQALCEKYEYAFDCATIDARGIIVSVAPEEYSYLLGMDISRQEQIVRLHARRQPVISLAIDTVEGFVGFDLEQPVFSKSGEYIGSVSILTKPDFFGTIINRKVANFPVEMWMMQKDGRMIYDINDEEIGKNLFTDALYADYPSLLQVAGKMAVTPQGSGQYRFLDKKMDKTVTKKLIWTTVALHGTEFRLALAYVETD